MSNTEIRLNSMGGNTAADPRKAGLVAVSFSIDFSGSEMTRVAKGVTRYDEQCTGVITMLRSLQTDRFAKDRVVVTISLFNDYVTKVIDNELISRIDLAALEQDLRSRRPDGVTNMGAAVVSAVNDLRDYKAAMYKAGTPLAAQPIFVLYTDGFPTMPDGEEDKEFTTMEEAFNLVDTLQEQRKLVVIPVGVSAHPDAKFPVLERLLRHSCTGERVRVCSDPASIAASFNYVGKTIAQTVAGGEETRLGSIERDLKALRERYGFKPVGRIITNT